MKSIFKLAEESDKEKIIKLYKSLIGQNGCTWDEKYPNEEIVDEDLKNDALYCIKNDNNEIIAVATLTKDTELERQLNQKYNNAYLLTRVGVSIEYQGKGYAKVLLHNLINYARDNEINLIYLLVNRENKKAINLYKSLDFEFSMEMDFYKMKWDLFKKIIV